MTVFDPKQTSNSANHHQQEILRARCIALQDEKKHVAFDLAWKVVQKRGERVIECLYEQL